MAVTSFNAVRKAIISSLDKTFSNTKVYGENFAQGFEEPCFFVKLLTASQKRIMDNRFYRYQTFDIHYFTDEEYVNDALHDIGEQLYNVLEYINVNGDLCEGTQMEYEIIDGVLHFYVHYNMIVYTEKPAIPFMEELILIQRGDD